jgi:hypothetical protein
LYNFSCIFQGPSKAALTFYGAVMTGPGGHPRARRWLLPRAARARSLTFGAAVGQPADLPFSSAAAAAANNKHLLFNRGSQSLANLPGFGGSRWRWQRPAFLAPRGSKQQMQEKRGGGGDDHKRQAAETGGDGGNRMPSIAEMLVF